MKGTVAGLGLATILLTMSCTSTLPIVENDNTGSTPLTLSVVSLPDPIDLEGVEVSINYAWNSNKSEFEQRQNAVGGIAYSIHVRKFGGGTDPLESRESRQIDLQETGTIKYHATSSMGQGYSTLGEGRLMVLVYCEYQDKDGRKHAGEVSNYLRVPVVFVR